MSTVRSKNIESGAFFSQDINSLLALDDEQLKAIIRGLAARSGVDIGTLNISEHDIASVRQALRAATDEDIARAMQQLGFGNGGD